MWSINKGYFVCGQTSPCPNLVTHIQAVEICQPPLGWTSSKHIQLIQKRLAQCVRHLVPHGHHPVEGARAGHVSAGLHRFPLPGLCVELMQIVHQLLIYLRASAAPEYVDGIPHGSLQGVRAPHHLAMAEPRGWRLPAAHFHILPAGGRSRKVQGMEGAGSGRCKEGGVT